MPQERQIAQLSVVGKIGQHPRRRSGQCGKGDACQQHQGDIGALGIGRDAVKDKGGQPAAQPGRQRNQSRSHAGNHCSGKEASEHDCKHRAKTRPRADADDSGIGKRIAKEALQQDPGHGERRAHGHPQRKARQADVEENDLVAGAQPLTPKGGEEIARPKPCRARSKRQDRRGKEKTGQGKRQRRAWQAAVGKRWGQGNHLAGRTVKRVMQRLGRLRSAGAEAQKQHPVHTDKCSSRCRGGL